MRWHEGFALTQTVFTCMYTHQADDLLDEDAILEDAATSGRAPYPVELVSLVLRAYIRATLKTCDVVMEEILKRHLYDVRYARCNSKHIIDQLLGCTERGLLL